MPRSTPLFVVSTGRSGSTLLGSLLGQLPGQVLLSEALCLLDPARLLHDHRTSAEFAAMLTEPVGAASMLTTHHLEPAEFRYPFDRLDMRYGRRDGIGPLSATTLPTLTKEPDELLADIERAYLHELYRPGVEPVSAHLRRLFDHLVDRFDGTGWIERSGASLDYVASLIEAYPDARFVHVHRRGADVAASMARHPMFRLHLLRIKVGQICGFDPYLAPGDGTDRLDEVPETLHWAIPGSFDPERFIAWDPPLHEFARLWALQIRTGLSALRELPVDRVHHVGYDDLVTRPVPTLVDVAQFIGADADAIGGWIGPAADHIEARDRDPITIDPATARVLRLGDRALTSAGLL